MKLVADEGVDGHIVARLRQDGHDVLYIAEKEPSISDDIVLSHANAQGALLLTEDKDFGELVFRQGLVHTGIVLIRLAGLSSEMKAATVSAVFRDHAAELSDAFSVISPGMVRIRHRQ
jgi:predicted nuclease of predicted toxin-antitoxin system